MTPIEQAKALAAYWRKEAENRKARETADLLDKLISELERP